MASVSTHELTNQIQVLRETTNVKADNFASQSSFIFFGQLTRKAWKSFQKDVKKLQLETVTVL